MSLSNFLVHTVEVSRRQPSTGVKTVYQVVETALRCNIQPLMPEYTAMTGMVYGRTYNAFFQLGADIQINDKVIDQDGKEYRVTGSAVRNYGTSAPHLSIMLSEQSHGGPDQ